VRRLAPLTLAVGVVAGAIWSWGSWPDVLVDYGQQLYVAWRIAEGDVLYRDLAYFHGPLSSYLGGMAMRVGGSSLLTLVTLNLTLLALFVTLLYRTMTRIADRNTALAAGWIFLGLFAFAQYVPGGNYNWVTPYTHEVTHGTMLAIATLALLGRAWRSGDRWARLLGGVTFGLCALTKVEVFAAAAAAVLVGQFLAYRQTPQRAAEFIGAAAIPPLIAWAGFSLAMPAPAAWAALSGPFVAAADGRLSDLLLYKLGLGTHDSWESLRRLALWSGLHLLVLGALLVAARLGRRLPRRRGFAIGSGLALFVALALVSDRVNWMEAWRPLPLWLGLLVVIRLRSAWGQRGGDHGERILAAAFCVFALALTAKMALNARIWNYGFVLAMPGTLLLAAALLHDLPRWFARRGERDDLLRVGAYALLAVCVVGPLQISHGYISAKRNSVGIAAGDRFRADDRGTTVQAMLERIVDTVPEDSSLLVLPDGIMLNYLARRQSSQRYLNYVPTEVIYYGEATMLAELEARPPDFVALVDKDTSDFGFRHFGTDYGRALQDWVAANYEVVALEGAPPLRGQGFGIVLARRKTHGL